MELYAPELLKEYNLSENNGGDKVRKKRFKAILSNLLIVAITIAQVSQVMVIHGMGDYRNAVSMSSPLIQTTKDNVGEDWGQPKTTPLPDAQLREFEDSVVNTSTLPNVEVSPQTDTALRSAAEDSVIETSIVPELLSVVEEIYSSDKVIINAITPVFLAAGANHSLQVKNDGTVWAWGDNSYGQLGDGTTTNRTIAVQVENLESVVAVSAGSNFSLALKSDGTVWSWGGNESDLTPVQVGGLNDITAISAGSFHSLVLKSDGTVWGWGDNFYRQLGDETTTEIGEPIQINGLYDVIDISAGYNHNLILKRDGTVWALGSNRCGQLGDGTFTDRSMPVRVNGISDVVKISAGEEFSLASKNDGTVWSWGNNTYSQLGVVTEPDETDVYEPLGSGHDYQPSEVPLLINGLSDVVDIRTGNIKGFALKRDGTVWTWGGDRSTYIIDIIQVEVISNITAIVAGTYHILAMNSDGTVWAWGDNYHGQLGDGTTIYKDTPVISKDVLPPTAPANLSASINEDSVVLNWEASTDEGYVVGYEIYRDDIMIGRTSETTYTDTDMDEVVKFHKYTVKGYDYSVNLSGGAIAVINDNEAPSVPMDLKLTSKTANAVSIEWKPSTDNAWVEGYAIYRNGEKIEDLNNTSYTDLNVPHNSTYTYTVKAYDSSANFSKDSSPLIVKTEAIKSVALAAGYYHSLNVRNDGTVWSWGYNEDGQLGDGTTTKRIAAVQVKNLQNVVAVSAGSRFSIALKNNGTVWAWGFNWYGQLGDGTTKTRYTPVKLDGLSNIISIEAGENHAIALKGDGTVWTWGDNGDGQLGDNDYYWNHYYPRKVDALDNVIKVAAGADHNLALKSDGTVWAWGSNRGGQLGEGTTESKEYTPIQVNGLIDIIDVKAGYSHSMVLKSDGTVWAWGTNGSGQLGDGTTTSSNLPVKVNELSDIIGFDTEYYSSLALKSDGTVWAWGSNSYGQLGDGTTITRLTPVQVNLLGDVVDVAIGTGHALALKSDETVWAWGYNRDGRLGDETDVNKNIPVLSKDVTPPSTPTNISLTKSENEIVLKWEASTDLAGVVGYEIYRDDIKIGTTSETTYTDTDVDEIVRFHTFTVRAYDYSGNLSEGALAVINDNEAPSIPSNLKVTSNTATTVSIEWEICIDNAWVEGYEIYRDGNKVGVSNETNYTDTVLPHNTAYIYTVKAYDKSANYSKDSNKVTATTGIIKAVPLSAGTNHSLQIRRDGTVWACGGNEYGQLGDGTNTSRIEFVQVDNLKNIVAVSAGHHYGVALMNNGTVWAWGYDNHGQLGDGTITNSNVPVQVNGLNDIIELEAGGYHSLALKSDGTVWAWGANWYGQLGAKTNSNVPVKVEGLTEVIGVAAGVNHSFALKSDGTVWAWGRNEYGQLGDGTTTNGSAPVQVNGLSDVIGLESGENHGLALKSDGTVWAWGSNWYGGLGNGTTTHSNVPVQVEGLIDVIGLAAGSYHSLALKSDKTVWAWGYNSDGRLGNGTKINSAFPVMVKELTDVTAIAAGGYHCLALKSNGTVLAWGTNGDGQLGDGTGITRIVPTVCVDKNPIIATVIEGFSGSAEQNGIKLFWKSKTEDYVYGYKIYRSETLEGPYTMIMQLNNRTSIDYVDKNYEAGNADEPCEKTFYYKISAIDKFGYESNKSEPVSVKVKTDSIVPVVLSIEPKDNMVIGSSTWVTVKAEDDFGISTITLQYSLDKAEWLDICTQSSNVFQWNTPVMNGKVYLRAIARDAAGNKSDGSPVITYILDHQGPSKVTGLKAIPSASSIILNWDDVPEDDFSYFRVECKNSTGEFTSVGTVSNKRGLELNGLQPETTYIYRVCAYDKMGNRGEVSDEISVATLIDVTAPVVTYLGPASSKYGDSINLSAAIYDNVTVVSVVFQVSKDKTNWTDIQSFNENYSNDVSVSHTYDTSDMEEGYIYFRCIATDYKGNVSSGAPVNEYYIDHTAPLKPSNVEAVATASYVDLKWAKGMEEDVRYFNIYRSIDGGAFSKIAGSYMYLNYRDTNVQNTSTYKYRISAVDIAGNESEFYETSSISLLSDIEKPKIYGVSYADNSTLPANPKIAVSATDNYLLESIGMKFRRSGTSDEWIIKSPFVNINKNSCIVEFLWSTNGLTDGNYDVVFTARDKSGYESDEYKVTYCLNVSAPAAPVLQAEPLGWKVELTWNANTEPDVAGYHIFRDDGTGGSYKLLYKATGTSYTDTAVEAGKTYRYYVEVVDQYMNKSRSNTVSAAPTDEDKQKPVAVISAESFSTTNTYILFDSTGSTDNHKVEKVLWEFGDGTVSSELKTYHKYTEVGEYRVKLTVYDSAGNSGTVEKDIVIYSEDTVSKIKVNVIDKSKGTGIAGAEVVVKMSDGTEKVLNTDESGCAYFMHHFAEDEKLGNLTAYVFKNGYTPTAEELSTIKAGEESTLVVRMAKGNVIEGELSFKRMTLEEVKAAGIDVTAPENQYVYSFSIHLGYSIVCNNKGQIYNNSTASTYTTYTIRESDTSTKDVYVYTVPSKDPTRPPNVVYIELPGEVKTLKEFFMVNLTVKNLSESEEIVLEGAKAKLNIPSGLTLAKGQVTQKLTPENVPGGSTANTSWILRGDNPGRYKISADFSGVLEPFNEIIEAVFVCAEPIIVEDATKAKLIIEVEKEKKPGDKILYRVGFKNERTREMNSPDISMQNSIYIRSYKTDVERNLIGTSSKVLKPGEIFWSEYYIDPEFFKDWNYVYRTLTEYSSKTLGGLHIPIEIKPVDYGTFGRVKPEIYVIDPDTGSETLCTNLDLVKYRSKDNDIMPDLKIKTGRGISQTEIVKEACELTIVDEIFGVTKTITTDSNGEYIYKGGSIDGVKLESDCRVFSVNVVPDIGVNSSLLVRMFDQNLMSEDEFGSVWVYVWNKDTREYVEGATIRIGSDSNIRVTDKSGWCRFNDIIFDDSKITVKVDGFPDKVMSGKLKDGMCVRIEISREPEITKVVSWCSDSSNNRSSILPLNLSDDSSITFKVDADLKGASEITEHLWRIVDKYGNIKYEGTSGKDRYITIDDFKSKMAVGDRIEFAIKTEGEYGEFTSDYVDAKLVLAPELKLLNGIAWTNSVKNVLFPEQFNTSGIDGCVKFVTDSDDSVEMPKDSGVFKAMKLISALQNFNLDVDYDFKNARLKVDTEISGELFSFETEDKKKEGNFGIESEANVSIYIVYNDVTLEWELESMDIHFETGVTVSVKFKVSVPLDAVFGGVALSGYAYVEIEGGVNFIVDVTIPNVSELDSLKDLIVEIQADVWLSIKGAVGLEIGYGLLSGEIYAMGQLDVNIPSFKSSLTLSYGYEYGYLWFFSEEVTLGEKTWILYDGNKKKQVLRMLSNYSTARTGVISDSTEDDGGIVFKSASRDYLENQKWIGKEEIMQDAYPDSDAQIAAIDKELGELIMVFIGDDSDRSDNNRTTVSSSIYKNGAWSKPIQIEDDGTGDAFPDIAVDNKDIYAVWLDMAEEMGETSSLTEDDITKNVLCKMGITVAQFDAKTNSWKNVLTEKTEGANKLPEVAAKDGKVLATWVNNAHGKAIGNDEQSDVLYYVYNNGTGWTEPKTFLTDVANVYESDLCIYGDKAYYAFVTNAYSEDGLYKLYITSFDGENWSMPKGALDNMYADKHPSIAVENGEPVVFWQNNNMIYKAPLRIPDKVQIVVNSEQAEEILELSATNTDEGIALAWTKAIAGEQRVYVSTYEESSSTWTQGMMINMNSMEIPKNVTLAGLNDTVMVVYNKNIYKRNEENSYYKDSTSLTSTVYIRNVDLAITKGGLYFAEGNPIPGKKATIIAAVENVGDLSVKGIKVSLYEGDKLVDTKELADVQLSNGDQTLVTFDWKVPGDSSGFSLRAVVEVVNDSDASNNTAKLELSYTDAEITGVHNELYTENTGLVYVDVKNSGYSNIQKATVYLATDKEFKNIISTKDIDNLNIFADKRVVFDLEVSDEQISSRARIYAKVEVGQRESNYFNNSDFTVIRPCELNLKELGTEEPGTGNPGTEEPGTGNPGTEEPGTGNPGTEEPGTGNPGTEEPGTGNPGTEEPGTGNPGKGNSGTGNSGTAGPKAGNSTTDVPTTGGSLTDVPTKPGDTSIPVTEPVPEVPTSGKNNKAYIRGYGDNTFRPEQSITRAEMAVILANLDGASKDNLESIEFKDVPKAHWAAWAISYVSEKGYFKGYEDSTYKPDRYITRAELCVVLSNYLDMESADGDENKLTDIKGHWAQKNIYKFISEGYVKGYPDDTFRPNNNVKRSECVTLINRVLGIASIKDAQTHFTDVGKSHWAYGDIMAATLAE